MYYISPSFHMLHSFFHFFFMICKEIPFPTYSTFIRHSLIWSWYCPIVFEDYHYIRSMFSWSSWIVLRKCLKSQFLEENVKWFIFSHSENWGERKVDIGTSQPMSWFPSQSIPLRKIPPKFLSFSPFLAKS